MRFVHLRRWLLTFGLASISLSAIPSADAQPRDRRAPARYDQPYNAPPPLRAERVGRRRGFVWISGEWEWSGRWTWRSGHWETARAGHRFAAARWERRGDIYVHVDGSWGGDIGAPPPLREERFDPRPGQVFIHGHWDWDGDNWEWVAGRFERERRGRRWREERWENRGGQWVMINGDWEEAPVSQYPTSAPPALRNENPGYRQGSIWDPGHWDWHNGAWDWVPGHWENERAGFTLHPGHWDNRGGHWEWIADSWDAAPVSPYPTSAPPTPRAENPGYRQGSIWDPGHWDWHNGAWDWVPGHWENERAGFTFHPGHWDNRGGHWQWIADSWDAAPVSPYPTSTPPALRGENPGYRQGSIWDPGHWDWHNGAWDWVPGHWELERAGFTLRPGRWEQHNGRWEWVADRWDTVASPYPTSAPPPYRAENPGTRDDHVWDPGHWDWRNGAWDWVPGHWERQRANSVWRAGRWENHNSRWEWIAGGWEAAPNNGYNGPRSAPPAARDENPGYRDDHIWAHGHYRWTNGAYEWVPGHWERERAYKHWVDARWEQRGNEWFLIDEHWE